MGVGGHGEICERTDHRNKITLRQPVTVWTLEETAVAIKRWGDLEMWTDREIMEEVTSKKALVELLTDYVVPCIVYRNPDSNPDWGYDEDDLAEASTILWHIKNVAPQFLKPTSQENFS